ncbi:hypothetical protein CC1G_01417 [Coprinopsis cinerea okayama7|uniref:Uncharacterized protein n=1 Tax=Coprinopsis cinerea (strain Okayama-7 / 130 / ATCC MYA-4618 / FGSC 9003) TaxID=240176 RepID=A8NYS0_COPC7|nr:hypothetical protein CC1G_01417 [Coprinopsis cinerea okayama7\|eukprot:XP_001837505.1 hypothetical protein CC1G_01417 [Coprinopsis cinerea okayama7\
MAKRKATDSASDPVAIKKLRMEEGAATVKAILDNAANSSLPEGSKAMHDRIVELAQYARLLEEENASLKPKTADIEAQVVKLAGVLKKGIPAVMKWKPTCSENRAKWEYEGICPDVEVWKAMFNIEGVPPSKQSLTKAEFFATTRGEIWASIRQALFLFQLSLFS